MKLCDNFLKMSQMKILFQIEVYPQRWQRYRLLSDFTSVEKSSPMRRVSPIRSSLLLLSSESEHTFVFLFYFPFPQAHRAEYEEILLGVQGDDQCKRLSSQFIGRWDFIFLLYFGKLHHNVEMTFFFCSGSSPTSPTSASSR